MTTKRSRLLLVFACFAALPFQLRAAPMQQPAFHVAKEYVVGGEGRWDLLAVDAKRHHLFISRSTHVQVVDTETGKVVADIPGTAGVHDIAIAEDIHSGFTSNGKSNTVTVFDLATLKVSETINIPGENPDVILYDPGTHHIFAFNGRSKNATVLDGASHRVLASVSLPGKPEIAVAGNNGKVYVNIEDKNEIAVIDTQTNKVVSTWPLGHGTEPTGLAIDPIHHRLFSVCANRTMAIVDSESGKLVAEKVIGDGPDSAAFDADLGMIFSANGDGTLTIVKQHDPDHYAVLQNLRTTKGARTMAYDPIAHTAYLVTALLDMSTAAAAGAKARPLIPESFRVLMVTPKSAY